MFKISTVIASATLLVACVPAKENTPETCPKSEFSALLGTNINTAILPLTLTYRTVYPGDAVTMDHLPERLNVAVNEDGIVEGLTCG